MDEALALHLTKPGSETLAFLVTIKKDTSATSERRMRFVKNVEKAKGSLIDTE